MIIPIVTAIAVAAIAPMTAAVRTALARTVIAVIALDSSPSVQGAIGHLNEGATRIWTIIRIVTAIAATAIAPMTAAVRTALARTVIVVIVSDTSLRAHRH